MKARKYHLVMKYIMANNRFHNHARVSLVAETPVDIILWYFHVLSLFVFWKLCIFLPNLSCSQI